MYRIDAHQHYWDPARGDYGWMPKDDEVLSRPYGPADLRPELARHGVNKTVLVQAAPTVEETEYLLGIADATPSVAAVVGWVDFENAEHRKVLERLAAHEKFVGVRPMIQDIEDDDWMLREDVQWGFQALIDLDLTLDALGYPKHLKNFHAIFTKYADLRVVIDHCMKPPIRDFGAHPEMFKDWANGMTRIAEDTGAYCKFSGLVTEANEDWSLDDLRPVTEHVLEKFGVNRVMWGSDWPVSRLRASYDEWVEASVELTRHLPIAEREEIFTGSAKRFYKL